jgi:hypothetical protein
MKIFTKLFLLVFIATPVLAQNELIIEPGTSENPVFINSIIHADTLETGERANPDRVYVLRRNGLYFISQELNIGANKLQIKAEAGEGFRPFIAPFPNEAGAYPRMFRVAGDLVLDGLHWNNINGEAYKWGGNANTGSNSRIEVRNCFIERDGGAGWMTYGLNGTYIFENCVLGNLGVPKKVGGNGRLFDTRGNVTDSVIIRHCTIYLISDRVFRNLGGELKYFEFDHNTVINAQGRHGSFSLGRIHNIKITNNLMMNPLYMGNHPGTQEQTHPDKDNFYVFGMDTAYSGLLDIHHNNVTFAQSVKDYYATNDSVSEPAVLEPLIISALGAAAPAAFFTEEITFTNVPPFPMDYLVSVFANPIADFHPDNFDISIGMSNIDASYSTTSLSFTGDENGKPLGSHMWWGPEVTGISKLKTMNGFKVSAYPNPATENVQVAYTLDNPSAINISVYDLQGRLIMTQFEGIKSAGTSTSILPVSSLTSGIYILQIQSNLQGMSVQQLVVK